MKVVNMSDKSEDAGRWAPEDTLKDALENYVGKSGAFEKGKKLLILALDDTDGKYNISYVQAGMKSSECACLCDIANSMFKEEIGY